MSLKKVYLGLPAYNEKASIQPLFEKIAKLKKELGPDLEILFYDDGCTDGTKEEVQAYADTLPVTYLDGVVNKGLGTGMNTILQHFAQCSTPGDLLAIMDCDDTHDPAQIPQMISAMESAQSDMVIASRYRKGGFIKGVPFNRIIMSYGAAALYKLVHPMRNVRDYTCGYRLYTNEIINKALRNNSNPLLKERGFSCMVELLLRLKGVKARAVEVPMLLSYDNKRSASKMDVSGNAFRLLKKLLEWRVRGLA